jgi:hypothetical protein
MCPSERPSSIPTEPCRSLTKRTLPGKKITLGELEQRSRRKFRINLHELWHPQQDPERYEEVTRTRWAKKTRAQRKAILENAWHAKIPVDHRPDLEDNRRAELDTDNEQSDAPDDIYMWPHINLEDLLTPKFSRQESIKSYYSCVVVLRKYHAFRKCPFISWRACGRDRVARFIWPPAELR